MKMLSRAAIAFVMAVLCVPLIHAQDLSKYRNFSFGMSAASVSKLAEEKLADVIVVHERPALIQELTWYPPLPFESVRPAEPVQKVLFSFYNGELYRILVTYDSDAVKGLTSEDMIQMLSAKYGTATRPAAEVNFPTNDAYRATEKVIARWEDPQYSLNLFRSSMSDTFAVVLFAKQLDAQAAAAIAESVKLERQEAPQVEAARVKQAAVDLEAERQKNIKALRP
ncbi:MAG TPA: hypothetical protein VN976_14985 [Verrucomicrobiae bacterium]|nr:hypothetical protein [Verrucomicrobiae bacterium]